VVAYSGYGFINKPLPYVGTWHYQLVEIFNMAYHRVINLLFL